MLISAWLPILLALQELAPFLEVILYRKGMRLPGIVLTSGTLLSLSYARLVLWLVGEPRLVDVPCALLCGMRLPLRQSQPLLSKDMKKPGASEITLVNSKHVCNGRMT